MKVTFEIDDAIYPIAKEWADFLKQHPLPSYDDNPKEFTRVDNIIEAEWKRFLKEHKLVKSKKTTRFMGEKIEHIKIKNCKEFKRAVEILILKNDY